MQVTYYTQKGSTYLCRTDGGQQKWFKRGRDGVFTPLAGAIHLPRTRLQDLLREYPRSALDTTVCFGNGLAEEFFEDARREHLPDIPDGVETNIFFLLSKAGGKYSLGYSSTIDRIEKTEVPQSAVKIG